MLCTCALRAGDPYLVQLDSAARYTILYGVMGQELHALTLPCTRSYALDTIRVQNAVSFRFSRTIQECYGCVLCSKGSK